MNHILKSRSLVWLALLAPAWLFLGCRKAEDPWKDVPAGVTRVLVTTPPLCCFAKAVAGDDAAVKCLLSSQGPHDYQPTFNDSLKARGADLFLFNGLELDDFAQKVANSSGNLKIKKIPVAEKALPKNMLLASEEKEEREQGGQEEHQHHHGEYDPHVWLGIPQTVKMVEFIRDTLQEANPAKKDAFARRADDYVKKLQDLHRHGEKALAGKKNRKLIATHDSLRYFAAAFKLDILDAIQPRPGIEAEPRKLAKLVKLCRQGNVRVIATERQYPKTAAEKLQDQLRRGKVEINLVEIDPMETVAESDPGPDYYLRTMRDNVDKLAKALP